MHGTLATKAGRLILDLVKHPMMVGGYLSSNVSKKAPIDLQLPWISFAAIGFLNNWLKESMEIFEWGAGGSTLFFASRTKNVLSIESDVTWYKDVRQALATSGYNNVDLRLLPLSNEADVFDRSAYLRAIKEKKWDLVMVDGVLGYGSGGDFGSYRRRCFQLAEEHILSGGIIVVDDIWMFPELLRHAKAHAYQEFQSVGPCRIGVTSTGVFFY
jgi:hypothetical protein